MALPKIQHTLYSHTLVGLGKQIKFRPFTNQEQKTLLLAKDAKGTADEKEAVVNAIEQIVGNCTLGKIDGSSLSTFDIEDLFLRIRAKSVGEVINVQYRYDFRDAEDRPQSRFIKAAINVDDIKVKVDPAHTKVIMVSDKIGMTMRYPTFKMLKDIKSEDDLPLECIDTIFDENEIHDRNSVTREELEAFYDDIDTAGLMKIKQFFDTMPSLQHTIELDVGDGKTETVTFKGLNDFFI
jgi:hypothetical protein